MIEVLPIVEGNMCDRMRPESYQGNLSAGCRGEAGDEDVRCGGPASARAAAELVAAVARQGLHAEPSPRPAYQEERRGSIPSSMPWDWQSEKSVNLEELLQEFGAHGPCTILDFIIERVDRHLPVGMDVVHGKNKLIVKAIHDISLVTKYDCPEDAYKSIMPGDVILSVNGYQRDANEMIDAFRATSMVGDSNVYLLVARFSNLKNNPYLVDGPAVELSDARHRATQSGTVDDDEDHMIVTRSVGGTCRLVARYLCKPLRIKV
mmetsp:Transcript_32803/g.59998  ORF Transcript_32803/g.59998 Transcript_32803/m.59998 type:complete len:263 (-) Transcript_32803:181-969(-)